MELNEKLKELIEPVLAANDVRLHDIRWLGNERTLQIAIMKEDGSMDLDTCAAVSEALSTVLDNYKELDQAYTLEVCSPGAEREIRDLSELEHMEKPYVYVRLRHPVNKQLEFTGEIQSFNNSVITLNYRDKAAHRTAEIHADNIEYIRLAVRI